MFRFTVLSLLGLLACKQGRTEFKYTAYVENKSPNTVEVVLRFASDKCSWLDPDQQETFSLLTQESQKIEAQYLCPNAEGQQAYLFYRIFPPDTRYRYFAFALPPELLVRPLGLESSVKVLYGSEEKVFVLSSSVRQDTIGNLLKEELSTEINYARGEFRVYLPDVEQVRIAIPVDQVDEAALSSMNYSNEGDFVTFDMEERWYEKIIRGSLDKTNKKIRCFSDSCAYTD